MHRCFRYLITTWLMQIVWINNLNICLLASQSHWSYHDKLWVLSWGVKLYIIKGTDLPITRVTVNSLLQPSYKFKSPHLWESVWRKYNHNKQLKSTNYDNLYELKGCYSGFVATFATENPIPLINIYILLEAGSNFYDLNFEPCLMQLSPVAWGA